MTYFTSVCVSFVILHRPRLPSRRVHPYCQYLFVSVRAICVISTGPAGPSVRRAHQAYDLFYIWARHFFGYFDVIR